MHRRRHFRREGRLLRYLDSDAILIPDEPDVFLHTIVSAPSPKPRAAIERDFDELDFPTVLEARNHNERDVRPRARRHIVRRCACATRSRKQ